MAKEENAGGEEILPSPVVVPSGTSISTGVGGSLNCQWLFQEARLLLATMSIYGCITFKQFFGQENY